MYSINRTNNTISPLQKRSFKDLGFGERLDLLVLGRQGRIVVIEHKLDDSGRDVIPQALK
jgi:hypothetical protein